MKQFPAVLSVFIFQTVLFAGGPPESGPGGGGYRSSGGVSIRVSRRYSGVCRVSGQAVATRVIRDRAAYYRFIRTIPTREIGMGPMPPSRDPLLRRPHINFSRYMLVVVANPRATYFRPPRITRVVRTGGSVTVRYRMRRRGNYPMQWPYGVGHYSAVVVPKSYGSIRFLKVN